MDPEKRITNIIARLEELTIETQELIQELRQLHTPTTNAHSSRPNFDHIFVLGDKVVITNNYLGKKGTRGIVTTVTAKRVTLTDSTGRKHTRKPSNLRYE